MPILEIPHSQPCSSCGSGLDIHSWMLSDDLGGKGQEFVLVHGLGMSSRYMLPTARLLTSHGTVHVPDLPGFGRSGKPRRTFSIAELSDVLGEWMAARGIELPVLIGNSLGGQVIADFAARNRGRLRYAVLVAPTVDPDARRVGTQFLRLLMDLPREPLALYGIGLADYAKAGWPRIIETLHSALTHPVRELMTQILCPVLLVRGACDPIVPQSWMEEAAHLIPVAELVVIAKAAHAVNFDDPAGLVEVIVNFLTSRESHA